MLIFLLSLGVTGNHEHPEMQESIYITELQNEKYFMYSGMHVNMLIPTFSGNCMNRPEGPSSTSFYVATNANKVSLVF